MKYIRKKGRWRTGEGRFTICEKVNGKEKHLCTLPKIEELLKCLSLYADDKKAYQKYSKLSEKTRENFAQDLLSEPSEDEIIKTLSEIDIDEMLE